MEQNQNPDPSQVTSLFQMNIDAQNSYNLRSSASWAKVLGVVGIATGAILILIMGITMSRLRGYGAYRYSSRRGLGGIFGDDQASTKTGLWILIIAGIIFVIGGMFSFSFGNKINAALRSNHQEGLNNGFTALRNYFALRCIVLIIVLLLLLMTLFSTMSNM